MNQKKVDTAGRVPLADAKKAADELLARLRFRGRGGRSFRLPAMVVGSIRRGEPSVKDIDILAFASARKSAPEVFDAIMPSVYLAETKKSSKGTLTKFAAGSRRFGGVFETDGKKFYVDIFLAKSSEKPFALFHYTGSASYNIRARAHAKELGLLLNQYGIFDKDRPQSRARGTSGIKSERAIATFLGLTFRPPEERT